MGKMLDEKQVINGLVILLSFFVGYRYGIKVSEAKGKKEEVEESASNKNGIFTFSDFGGDYKMVLVVRNDLKMGKGKIAAQCGHAAVGAYEQGMKKYPQLIRRWNSSGSAKIAVKVETEHELNELHRQARSNGLNCCVIRDAGRTQIEPNTKTVLAIGPALIRDVDKITGHLKLL